MAWRAAFTVALVVGVGIGCSLNTRGVAVAQSFTCTAELQNADRGMVQLESASSTMPPFDERIYYTGACGNESVEDVGGEWSRELRRVTETDPRFTAAARTSGGPWCRAPVGACGLPATAPDDSVMCGADITGLEPLPLCPPARDPCLEIDPPSARPNFEGEVDFGVQSVGTCGDPATDTTCPRRAVTVRNTCSTEVLVVLDGQVLQPFTDPRGRHYEDFAVAANSCAPDPSSGVMALPPAGTCDFTVAYSPSVREEALARIHFNQDFRHLYHFRVAGTGQ